MTTEQKTLASREYSRSKSITTRVTRRLIVADKPDALRYGKTGVPIMPLRLAIVFGRVDDGPWQLNTSASKLYGFRRLKGGGAGTEVAIEALWWPEWAEEFASQIREELENADD